MIDSMGLALKKPQAPPMTVDEFIDWCDARDAEGDIERYELVDGQVVAMVRTTLNHARVVGNCFRVIGNHLSGTACEVWSEGILVKAREDRGFLPDVLVTCRGTLPGTSRISDPPSLIIEVLSPSNHSHDRSVKLDAYRQMQSLQQYVIVDPMALTVESHVRVRGGEWLFADHTLGGVLPLPAIDFELPLTNIFNRVDAS